LLLSQPRSFPPFDSLWLLWAFLFLRSFTITLAKHYAVLQVIVFLAIRGSFFAAFTALQCSSLRLSLVLLPLSGLLFALFEDWCFSL
jgi:hypothetical protein